MSVRSVLILAELAGDTRSLLEADCADAGYQATWYTSTEMLGARLTAGKFDALVVHLQTPGAARACLEARKLLTRVHLPIIALSDDLDETVHSKAFRVGADDVMHAIDSAKLSGRLAHLERPGYKHVGRSRGEALIIDADSNRAESIGRLLKDAGYFVKFVREHAAAKLHFNRPSVRLVVTEAEPGATAASIKQGNQDEWHPHWIVRARPSEIESVSRELGMFANATVIDAYLSPNDVLYEANRLSKPGADAVGVGLLYGTMVTVSAGDQNWKEHAYSYRVSTDGLSLRSLAQPPVDNVELELRDPYAGDITRVSGKVTRRRHFGPIQEELEPPGFSVQLSGQGQVRWCEQVRAAYERRYGKALPEPERAPESPRDGPPSSGGAAIGRVKLVSSGTLPTYVERTRRVAVEEPAPNLKPVPVLSIDAHGETTREPSSSPVAEEAGTAAASPARESTQCNDEGQGESSGRALATPPIEAPPERAEPAKTAKPEKTPRVLEPVAPAEQPIEPPAAHPAAQSSPPVPTKAGKPRRSARPRAASDEAKPVPHPQKPVPNEKRVNQERKGSRAGFALAAAGAIAVIAAGASLARMASRDPIPTRDAGARPASSDLRATPDSTSVQALSSAPSEGYATPLRTERGSKAAPHPSGDSAAPAPVGSTVSDSPRAPAASEPDKDPTTLAGHLGYLHVTSSLDTQVFVQGRLAGKTNTLLETFCGRRYVRLGSAPGHWESDGVTFRIQCQAVNRLTLEPAAQAEP